jgi:hypothetical protein
MSSAEKLARRREELLAISEVQRQLLILEYQALNTELTTARQGLNRALELLRQIRSNPLIFAGLGMALVLIKPSRIGRAFQQTQTFWQRIRLILPLLMPLLRRDKVE